MAASRVRSSPICSTATSFWYSSPTFLRNVFTTVSEEPPNLLMAIFLPFRSCGVLILSVPRTTKFMYGLGETNNRMSAPALLAAAISEGPELANSSSPAIAD